MKKLNEEFYVGRLAALMLALTINVCLVDIIFGECGLMIWMVVNGAALLAAMAIYEDKLLDAFGKLFAKEEA